MEEIGDGVFGELFHSRAFNILFSTITTSSSINLQFISSIILVTPDKRLISVPEMFDKNLVTRCRFFQLLL